MKSSSFLVAALLFALCSSAQQIKQTQAPGFVVDAFKAKFPKTTDVEWRKKGSAYEVMFDTGFGTGNQVLMDSTGKILSHIQSVASTDLPAPVSSAVTKQFPDFRVGESEKRNISGKITYKINLKGKVEEWDVIFSEDGTLLEKTAG
jgi:hypothetical protein